LRHKVLAALGTLLVSHGTVAQVGVFTYHNDNSRTGQNTHETVLAPANVNATQFGKLFSQPLDGDIYAQPLYARDAVFVATAADSLYALDANNPGTILWRASLLPPGATPVGAADLACAAIAPEVGITATPVIDPVRQTLYVEAFSKENGALVHRLHALDITTGAERRGSPVVVTAPTFDPAHQLGRAGLLLTNDTVYVAYGSHCDKPRFQGWILAYDATTLANKGAFATAPEHGKAAIWMSGAAPAADAQGNVFVATGDGWFAPPAELGNSILKLSGRLTLLDYFTPFNQASLARHDGDLGSGGVLLLPGHELLEVGKGGTVYLLDRDTLTAGNQHYCAGCRSNRQILQELPAAIFGGVWGMPAYWHDTVYVGGSQDVVRAFALRQGRLQPMPVAQSRDICEYPGCGLSISANDSRDGILWALQVGGYDSREPAVLRAYDALDLDRLLYASDQQPGRDAPGGAVRFTIPTVFNGKVYVGGAGQLTVFGPLGRH
jgi:outer membrane protein assembly factor BamB